MMEGAAMTLKDAVEGKEYTVKSINTDDDELNSFLFSLGCYSGVKSYCCANKTYLIVKSDLV